MKNAKKLLAIFIIFICNFYFFASDSFAWLEGYSSRKEITVQSDNIDANLTDFPLYIKIINDTDIGLGIVDQSTYTDIRFTDSNDVVLPYEQESMNISGGSATGAYWVKTNLDNSTGATIYVYYGKSNGTDGSSSTQVWNDGYKGVWHLEEGTSTTSDFFKDSTVNNNDGTLTDVDGDVSQVSGQVGSGVYFTGEDGETDRINVGNDSSLDLGSTFTLSGWVNVDNHNSRDGGYGFIISKDNYPNGGSYDLGFRLSSPYVAINTNPTGSNWGVYSVDDVLPTDSWYYLTAVRNSDNSLDYYIDGTLDKSFTGVNSPALSTTDVTFGLRSVDTLELNAGIDELRIEDVSRTSEWIKFAHANMGGQVDNELTWGSNQVLARTNSSESSSSVTVSDTIHAPNCSSLKPVSIVNLFEIKTTENTATVFFSPILSTDRYFISYSENKLAEEHGVEVRLGSLGVQNFTVNYLKSNTEYYFKVRGQNGCMPGDWSNILKTSTKNLQLTDGKDVIKAEQVIEQDETKFTTKSESEVIQKNIKNIDDMVKDEILKNEEPDNRTFLQKLFSKISLLFD